MTLESIRLLLSELGAEEPAAVVGECIAKYDKDGDVDRFRLEFEPKGRFARLRIDSTMVSDLEKGLWAGQLLSALIALSAQLADFHKRNVEPDIAFFRSRFGVANEMMPAVKCEDCGCLMVTSAQVDMYVAKIVLARRLVNAMEQGTMTEEVEALLERRVPDITRERRKALLRVSNSSIPYLETYERAAACDRCGSKKIKLVRLLRSNKENVFIPLDHS